MDELLTKEEILGGLPAGRAHTALFLIESQTARQMARAQQAMDVHLTEQGDLAHSAPSGQVPNAAVLRRLTFQIGDTSAREVKVWAYQVEPEGTCTALPARLALSSAGGEAGASHDLSAGPVLAPWSGKDGRIELAFRSADFAAEPEKGDRMP